MSDALEGRVRMMVSRAIVRLVDDERRAQECQVELLDDEVADGMERFQQYGLTSHPFPGAEAVVVCVGGTRSHGIIIAVEDRTYRLSGLETGEVALYDDQGQVVHLKRDGIHIESELKVVVQAPTVTVEADTVNLGGTGGAGVARIGDAVSGGVITGGSTRVKAT